MSPKYVVHSGYVISENDGQSHFVAVPQVANLYGLKPGEWLRWRPGLPADDDQTHLYPRSDGRYVLPR